MNSLIFFLIALALALTLGLVALDDPGYILISRTPYEIEISLAFFLLLMLLVFTGLYFLARMFFRSLNARRDLAEWRRRRNRDRAGKDVLQGYARLIEGNWQEAERELQQRIGYSDTPLINYLGSAYAAQQRGDYGRRDAYLDTALKSDRRFREAVQLTRIRLQYQAGQLEDARQTIESLPAAARKRPTVERMEAEVLRSLGDFEMLEKRLPKLKRHNAFSEVELHDLEKEAFGGQFRESLPAPVDAGQVAKAWNALPKDSRRDPEMVLDYVKNLIRAGDSAKAEDQIETALQHHWDPRLVRMFAELEDIQLRNRIRQCLVWREKHPEDGALLLVLARLYQRADELASAQEFYVAAIKHGADEAAYLELGGLLERNGEMEEASRCYRRGLEVRARQQKQLLLPAEANSEG